MPDSSVRIIVGLKNDFTRGSAMVLNSLEQIRRSVFNLNTAIAVFGAGTMAKGFLDTAAQMDKTLTLLKRLEGSAESARTSFEWMLKFGERNAAVANIEQFQQAFVRLKVAGLDPAAGSLQALTNAVAAFGGSSDDLQKASVAIFQMAGKNAINMEELRQQLGERVPTAIKIMARELGITIEQLNKFTETSVLTGKNAQIALQALFRGFEKDYGGAAQELSTTWTGMMNQLGVKWEIFKLKVMDSGPFQRLKEHLSDLVEYLNSPAGMRKMDQWAKDFSESMMGLLNYAREIASAFTEVGTAISSISTIWNAIPSDLKAGILAGGAVGYAAKNPALGLGVGVGTVVSRSAEALVRPWAEGAADMYLSGTRALGLTPAKKGPGLSGRTTYQDYIDQKVAQQDAMEAMRRRNARVAYSPKLELELSGKGAETAAKKAAAALALFNNAVRDVNKEFAEVTGDKSAVWLAQWEDKFADLQSKIMAGKNQQEVDAAMARLRAADEATRKAIASGYSNMVEAREDLEKFKQELAALTTGDEKEDDRQRMNARLGNLLGVGLVTPEDVEKYKSLKNSQWQQQKDKENLETKRAFYQEYIRIAGEGFAFVMDSILQQAQVYRDAKVSEEHIAKWVEYQKLQYSKEWSDGAKRGLLNYANAAMDSAAQMEDLFTKGFQSMEDALVEFTMTGKASFEDMINSMISDLMRYYIRSQILGPLAQAGAGFISNLFGGGGSAGSYSMVDGIGGWGGRAAGGPVDAGKVYRVGENGMEWFAPGVDGTIIPRMQGGGSASRGVQINIIESQGKGGQQEQRRDGDVDVIDVFFDMIDTRQAAGIMNGGTKTSGALSHVFGLNRANGALR